MIRNLLSTDFNNKTCDIICQIIDWKSCDIVIKDEDEEDDEDEGKYKKKNRNLIIIL